jgi:hypothetical protein
MQTHFANFWCLKIQYLIIMDRFVHKKKVKTRLFLVLRHIICLASKIEFFDGLGLVILYVIMI